MAKQKHFYLIRGLIREKRHWGKFLTELQKAFPDAKISTIELPGAGDYYQFSSPLSVKGLVEKMRQDFLKVKMPDENSHLVAISLGGMIALEWMKTFPKDFHQASLINTSFADISPIHQRLLPEAFLFLLKAFILKGRKREARILKLVTNHADIFDETLDLWETIQRDKPVSVPNTLRQLFAGATFRVGKFTPEIPIQVIASTTDRMVSVECSRTIAKKWNLPIVEHPTGGHDLTADDPVWVVNQL